MPSGKRPAWKAVVKRAAMVAVAGIERVVAKRTPVAITWVEGGRLAGPIGQHVRKKRRHNQRGVPGWIG